LAEALLIAGLHAREGQNDWFAWHRELWEIRDESHRYNQLIESLESLAKQVSGDQLFEVLERLAQTQQKNGDFITARSMMRELLLNVKEDPVRIARLRRLVIQNYVEAGLLEDAESASIRYQEEYFPDDIEWNLLRSQILIENKEFSKAVVHLAGLQDQKARLMLALARLNEGSMQPKAVITYLETNDAFLMTSKRLEHFRVAIIAEAARVSNAPRIRVKMLEILLANDVDKVAMLPEMGSEQLIRAYVNLALKEGNKSHLLVGNNVEWVKYADRLPSEKGDIARAIFVLLLQGTLSDPVAMVAHEGLLELLLSEKLYGVVISLYGPNGSFGPLPDVDETLLLRLSRVALEKGDYPIATDIATKLKTTPKGITTWDWQLQLARLEIFSSRPQIGADRLLKMLGIADELEGEQLDRLLQVAFDLQAISRHDLALTVFRVAGPFTSTIRQRRELLFWMGESQMGQRRYAQAADLFLQSSEVGGQQLDLWGQSARFRAADALVDVGLLKDAFNIYRSLLDESTDEHRQLQLRQKLQEINLLEAIRLESKA
jgi:hypothetical protein